MTTRLQPESHLDADQLAAFAEGALPAAERALCLQHLAECAHCREVAFLAGMALPENEAAAAPARMFSFPWLPLLSLGGATLAAVVVAVLLLHHDRQSKPSTQIQMASRSSLTAPAPLTATAPIDRPLPAEPNLQVVPKPSRAQKTSPRPKEALKEPQAMDEAMAATAATAAPVVTASPRASGNNETLQGASNLSFAPPAAAAQQSQSGQAVSGGVAKAKAPSATLRAYSQAYKRSLAGSPGIMGTITDSAGATIAHAKVTLDQTQGTAHRETFTDSAGRFTISSLQPGKYRLEISSPGFMSQVCEVEVGTTEFAKADSKLAVGAVSETVEVQAAAPAMDTQSATVSRSVQTILPDKQSLQTSVTNGTRTVALDRAGKLFLSKKPGKRWKAVRGPWKKSVVTNLALTTDQSFKVTSAQGSWLSTDGEHWRSTN